MVSRRSGPASSRPPRVAGFDPVPVPRENRRLSMAMPAPQGDEDATAVPADRLPDGSEPSATPRGESATESSTSPPRTEYGMPAGPPGTDYTSTGAETPSTTAPPAPADAARIPE